ncbi:unnamed protein product [Ceutorhynchus assimilis]|uniref:Uncharacterized protein n=1 Tax=Ceutorhynchus assimilis TaxID=467358 RepID=A0A9N9MSK1_9CUCU|nr:unnamed protein product [Ceutorhynchus assimilis]
MSKVSVIFALMVILVAFVGDSCQYVSAPTCFGQPCPASTTSCKEHRQSSQDRTRIEVQITCLDEFDASVKDYHFEEPSHMDRYTFYKNTKYESINEGISHADPYKNRPLDLTPYDQQPEYF